MAASVLASSTKWDNACTSPEVRLKTYRDFGIACAIALLLHYFIDPTVPASRVLHLALHLFIGVAACVSEKRVRPAGFPVMLIAVVINLVAIVPFLLPLIAPSAMKVGRAAWDISSFNLWTPSLAYLGYSAGLYFAYLVAVSQKPGSRSLPAMDSTKTSQILLASVGAALGMAALYTLLSGVNPIAMLTDPMAQFESVREASFGFIRQIAIGFISISAGLVARLMLVGERRKAGLVLFVMLMFASLLLGQKLTFALLMFAVGASAGRLFPEKRMPIILGTFAVSITLGILLFMWRGTPLSTMIEDLTFYNHQFWFLTHTTETLKTDFKFMEQSVTGIFAYAIPRAVWPGKPTDLQTLHTALYPDVLGMEIDGPISLFVPGLSEAWLGGGLAACIGSGLLLGWVLGYFTSSADKGSLLAYIVEPFCLLQIYSVNRAGLLNQNIHDFLITLVLALMFRKVIMTWIARRAPGSQ